MSKALAGRVAFVFLVFLGSLLVQAGFPLVQAGRPAASMVQPIASPPELKSAIHRFRRTLSQVTGAWLPVKSSTDGGRQIVFDLHAPESVMTLDDFSISFQQENILRIAGTTRSVQWALNHLLREFAGVEWLFAEECGLSYRPLADVIIPRRDIHQKNCSFPAGRTNDIRNRWWTMNMGWGLRIDHSLTKHAFPRKLYEKQGWPAEIMPMHRGKRLTAPPNPACPWNFWQPCYSNPKVADLAAENLLAYLKQHPGLLGISLGCNDNAGYCQCPECMKMDGMSARNRSESYFTFVNRVLEKVAPHYPKMVFTVFAYDYTINPPSFPLHKQALTVLTIDSGAWLEPRIMERHKKLVEAWSSKASLLGIWDYDWGRPYFVPRVYPRLHGEFLRFLHDHKVRLYYGENGCGDALNGPDQYLVARLTWNIRENVNEVLNDWYVRCVGKKAAGYLKDYYQIWERYFAGRARQTPWHKSAGSVYMTYTDRSHIYGIREEDIRQADKAMAQVVRLAEGPQEKRRAALMNDLWQASRLLLKMHGAGIYDVKGQLSTADDALRLLQEVKQYPRYLRRYVDIYTRLNQDRNLKPYYTSKAWLGSYSIHHDQWDQAPASCLLSASTFSGDPRVAAMMKQLGEDREQPDVLAALSRTLASSKPQDSILDGGNAEKGIPETITIHPDMTCYGKLSVTRQYHAEGNQAFQVDINGHDILCWMVAPAKPSTTYLATFKVFLPQPSAEGYLECALYAERSGKNLQWRNLPALKVPGGVWKSFSAMTTTHRKADSVRLRIYMRNFQAPEKVFIDDVQIHEVK